MKNLSTLALLTLLLVAAASSAASARILRVNNTGLTGTVPNPIYTTLQAAHDAASTSQVDTLHVEPSGTSYGGLTLTRRVVILGPGYFLGTSENSGLQANPATALADAIFFNGGATGSAGSVISGMTGNGTSTWYIAANNVTIQRCKMYQIYTGYVFAASNMNIRQNYVTYINSNGTPNNNMLITNNIITQYISLSSNQNGEFTNNIVLSSASMDNFNVRNNYFASSFTPNSNIHSHNATAQSAASQPAFTAANNSQTSIAQSAVFMLTPAAPGQFDAWYLLKAGTNALRGTGQGGTDIGAFGGNTPYKLGGLPAIPSIYQYNQSVNGNTLNVNMSTRSNN